MPRIDQAATRPGQEPARRENAHTGTTTPRSRARCTWALLGLLWLATVPGAARAQQQYWYDGDQRRALWSEPSLLADFGVRSAEKARILKPAALAKGDASLQSPVFRDGSGDASPRRALPGGVIVRIDPSMPADRRAALIARHRLEVVRELGDTTGLWLVRSAPGLPALELANRLYESGDFLAASPNWWRPRALK